VCDRDAALSVVQRFGARVKHERRNAAALDASDGRVVVTDDWRRKRLLALRRFVSHFDGGRRYRPLRVDDRAELREFARSAVYDGF
jgi:hypothetical protein